MKKTLFVVMLLILVLAFAACAEQAPQEDAGPGVAVGSVNGVSIYQDEYDYYIGDYYNYYYTTYLNYYGIDLADQATVESYMPNFVADLEYYSWLRCVESELLIQLAANEFGVTYENEYLASFMPYGQYRYMLANGVYNQLMTSEQVLTQAREAAEADYNAAPTEYRGTSHILVACDDVNDEDLKAAAYAIANELIAQLQAGADFDTLAAEHTADGNVTYNPIDASGAMIDGSTSFVPEYAEAAFALAAAGDFTLEPVLSDYGYHIIRLDSVLSSFDEVADYIVSPDAYISELSESYMDKAEIVCNVDYKFYSEEGAAEDEAGAEPEAEAEPEAGSEPEAEPAAE